MLLIGDQADDRLIPEDQKEGVRQRLLAFLEEPDFSVRRPRQIIRDEVVLMIDRPTSIVIAGNYSSYRITEPLDIVTRDSPPTAFHLSIPLIEQRLLVCDLDRAGKHTMDDQCPSEGMEEC